ncbi:MAG: hypothetical protein EB015_18035, partial [Methylocystaceae bacterium]|nr:hypothetical protein [Methylocystaceae bacterium]
MKINLALIGAFFLASMGCAALAQSSAYKGPIIDVHVHVENGQAQDFIQTMDKEKVEFAVSMAFPADRVKLTSSNKKLLSLCDAEFIRPLANGDNATALAWAKRHIGKDCIGFGEVGVRHYNKTAKRDGGKDQPTYVAPFQSDAMDVFLSHANNQAKPVVFHIEPFYDVKKINSLTEVKRFYVEICQKFPKIKIIAAHNGMMPASDLEDLFKKCFNLF